MTSDSRRSLVGLLFILLCCVATFVSADAIKRSSGSLHPAGGRVGNGGRGFSLLGNNKDLPSADPKTVQERTGTINPENSFYDVPATGAYIIWRNDSIAQIGELLTLKIADTANTDTSVPPVSGSNSEASYTFSSFAIDLDLEGFSIGQDTQLRMFNVDYPAPLSVGWSLFQFVLVFNYHICAQSWPNPCEDGWIQVYTTNKGITSVQVDLEVDFSGPEVSVTASSAALNFPDDAIDIYVQCTDDFCLIPPSDIANAVASEFVTVFQTGLVTEFNTVVAAFIDKIPTTINIPEYHLQFQIAGGFSLIPDGVTIPNFVFYADGSFLPTSGPSQSPPFSPTFIPPDSIFTWPDAAANVLITEFAVRTGIWALSENGDFNKTITQQNIPPSAKLELNTNSFELKLAVPGLRSYPNMNISIDVSLYNVSEVDIIPGGSIVKNTFLASFSLYNTTYTHPGWELLIDVEFMIAFSVSLTSSNLVQVATNVTNWSSSVALLSTQVGNVASFIFADAIKYFLTSDAPKVPDFSIPAPAAVVVQNPFAFTYNGFMEVSSTISYAGSVPSQQCGSSSQVCPEQNTCCQWADGWGCCTLPGASCCKNGCCPNGWTCDDGECVSN